MLVEMLRKLEGRYPWLSEWTGGRLDLELPAISVSLLVHGLLLTGLAFAGYTVHRESQSAFRSELTDTRIESADSVFQDLDQSKEPPAEIPAAGTFAPNLAATITSAPSSASTVPVAAMEERSITAEMAPLDLKRATEVVVPTANLLAQNLSIRGNGAETVGGVEGAVDRIATEIIRHLEKGPTLVVWAFDASGSLVTERQRLAKHIEAVYSHIQQLDESHLAADSGLLTMVIAFGQTRKAMLTHPSADLSEILNAIHEVPQDESGVETTFTTVGEIAAKWGRYKGKEAQTHAYRTMTIVVTDEVGDDESRLEDAIAACRKAKIPVYVLGSQAIFGRTENHVTYVDPKTKHVFHGVPVRQGPESVMLEQIRLPFWYNGPQFEIVESGFGPYALSRLAAETGGIYFVTRFDTRRLGFDPARMREYRPDWIPRGEYEKRIQHSPLRQAVLTAAQITQQNLPGMPGLNFPPADSPEFKEIMARNQAVAERTVYTVDEAIAPINAAAKLRDREPSRRWQAHFDLIRGRLLAMKVRCYEYNWACARMKKDTPKFSNPKSNAWRLVPDTAIQYSKNAAAAAKEAEALLRRVVDEHPATPWALLAQRELKDPLGFKWVETYVPPAPRRDNAAEAKKKKMQPKPVKPLELPKL